MKQTISLRTVRITDGKTVWFGADQRWYSNPWYSFTGCGPTTAAMVTMHMAGAFADTCAPLYPFMLPANKQDFSEHMLDIRPYVKPGAMGLNSTEKFAVGTAQFAEQRGVHITPVIVNRSDDCGEALGHIQKAVEKNLMPALMILRNPSKELRDYHWHWMAVTGCDMKAKTVFVATYGREFELPIEQAWHQQEPYETGIVYFYPDSLSEG